MAVQVDILFDEHLKYNRVAGEICATDPNLKESVNDLLKVLIRHEKMEEALVFPLYRELITRLSRNEGTLDNELEDKYDIFMRTRNRLIEDPMFSESSWRMLQEGYTGWSFCPFSRRCFITSDLKRNCYIHQ